MVEIRGNMATRLRKLIESDATDALILARAAIDRLGDGLVSPSLHVSVIEEMLPAPGQGAIGVECREGDAATKSLLKAIHHVETALCVNAERDLLRSLGGGCSLPLGARAVMKDGKVHLLAALLKVAVSAGFHADGPQIGFALATQLNQYPNRGVPIFETLAGGHGGCCGLFLLAAPEFSERV